MQIAECGFRIDMKSNVIFMIPQSANPNPPACAKAGLAGRQLKGRNTDG